MSVSTWAQRRAFAPAARKQRADTSVGRKPKDGRKVTASRRAEVMWDGKTLRHRLLWNAVESGVSGGALKRWRCRTRRIMAVTGHKTGSPLRPRPMTSLRTPFFCVVNVRVAKVEERSSSMEARARSSRV